MHPSSSIALDGDLLLAAFVSMALAYVFARQFLGRGTSLVLSCLKAIICFLYFAFFYDRAWHMLDDISYWRIGKDFVEAQFTPLSVFGIDGLSLLFYKSGGTHILYAIWNFFAQYFLGTHYYAPVFLNVSMTFLCAYGLYLTIVELKFSEAKAKIIAILFLLHPELIAWSSFINIKDILVMTLTIFVLYYVLVWSRTRRRKYLYILAGLFFLCAFIRFYVPPILILSYIIYRLIRLRPRDALVLLVVVTIFGLYLRRHFEILSSLALGEFLFGFVHFITTPVPWRAENEYTFLIIPAWISWFLLPFLPLGFLKVWKTNREAQLVLIFLLVTIVLFSITPEVRGPRHRLHLLPIIAWLEFYFVLKFLPQKEASKEMVPS